MPLIDQINSSDDLLRRILERGPVQPVESADVEPLRQSLSARKIQALGSRPGIGSRLATGVIKGGLVTAPITGAIGAYLDSPESVEQLAQSSGIDNTTRGGNILANMLNAAVRTSNAATLGVAGRLVGGFRMEDAMNPLIGGPIAETGRALWRAGGEARGELADLAQSGLDWWNAPRVSTSAPGVTASGFSNVPIDAGDFARGEPAAAVAARTGGGVARLAAPVMPADTTSLIPGTTVMRTIQNLPGGFDPGTITDGRYTPGPAYGGGQVEIQRGGLSPRQEILDMVAAANRNQDVQTASLLREARIGSRTSREAAAKEAEILSKAAGQPTGTDLMARVLQSQEAGNAAETTANIQAKSALERERLQQAGATSRHDFAGARVKQLEANAIMEMLNPGTNPERRALLRNTFGFGGKQADTTKVGEAQKAVQTLLANAKSAAEYARILEAQLDAQKLGKSGADLVDFINRALISPQTGVKP